MSRATPQRESAPLSSTSRSAPQDRRSNRSSGGRSDRPGRRGNAVRCATPFLMMISIALPGSTRALSPGSGSVRHGRIPACNGSRSALPQRHRRVAIMTNSARAFSHSIRAAALCLSVAATPSVIEAQAVRWGIAAGGATSVWSGPYQEGGRQAPTLAVWAEMPPTSRLALRAEAGAGNFAADFGNETTLNVGQLHLGALGRLYFGHAAPSRRWFAELGSAGWRRTFCDIDTAAGGGFLGGRTDSCEQWRPLLHAGDPPLRPRPGGAAIQAGAGFRLERFGINARYTHGVGPILDAAEDRLRVRQYSLVAEWALGR
jgi:hypothetical protein